MPNQVGRLILEKMRRDALTYEQLEVLSGISRSQLNNLVNKPEMTPHLPTLAALAKALALPLYQLVESAGFDLGLSEASGTHQRGGLGDVLAALVAIDDPQTFAVALAAAPEEAQAAIRTFVKAYLDQKL